MLIIIPIIGAVIGLFFLIRHFAYKNAFNRSVRKTGEHWNEIGKTVLGRLYFTKTKIDENKREEMLSFLEKEDQDSQIFFHVTEEKTEVYIKANMSAVNAFDHQFVDTKQLVFERYINYDDIIADLKEIVAREELKESRRLVGEMPRRKYYVLMSLKDNGSSSVKEIKLNEEELYNVKMEEVASILEELIAEGYVSKEDKEYTISNVRKVEEYLDKNSLFYKKDKKLSKKEQEASNEEIRKIILNSVNKEKWYSIKELKELNGKIQLLSSQKISSILQSMVDEKLVKKNGAEYKFLSV